jgi:RHS repeat-associated protein
VAVSGQTTQFIYDGDGNLVKKVKPDNSKTIYVGGIYEVDKTSGGSVTRTVTYYPVAGAMRINSTLYYTLKDHLGSASVVTDASGNILGTQRYYPYGETRVTTGSIFTDKLFTGQREMAGLGIYHYGARFYSPKSGRFLSADTIVPGAANPQAYNRYSYVLGNPLRYTDPSGHSQCQTQEDCDDIGTTPMGTGNPHNGGGSNNNGNNGDPHDDDNEIDPNPSSLKIPEVGQPLSSSSPTFWDAANAYADIAEGGLFAVISVSALISSCTLAGFACLITAPIFFTMAVVGAQHMFNGIQTVRQWEDPSIQPTGREVIDVVFPFLKKKR